MQACHGRDACCPIRPFVVIEAVHRFIATNTGSFFDAPSPKPCIHHSSTKRKENRYMDD